jgi:murein DD-endopeptidase MepM/ murein hydrolase activator NlpD
VEINIILTFCIFIAPFAINGQSFNTVTYTRSLPKVELSVAKQLDSISQELNIIDTLSGATAQEYLKVEDQRNTAMPLKTIKINDSYGYRIHPIFGTKMFHAGIDLASRRDTVYAMFDSVVFKEAVSLGLGLHIELAHSEGLTSIYGHLSKVFVYKGDLIKAGEPIGITGSTGTATGDHLHLSIKKENRSINPGPVLKYVIESELTYWAMGVVKTSVSRK